MGAYAEKATGAIYWDKTDKRGLSPLELVRRAASLHDTRWQSLPQSEQDSAFPRSRE